MHPGQEYKIQQSKTDLCREIINSIAGNKDIIRDFERTINSYADSKMSIVLRDIDSLKASINWNIRDMHKKMKQIISL